MVPTPARASAGGRWGPRGQSAAVSVTFDNLGEAMELSLGTWPKDKTIGRHYSATEVLPRIVGLLDDVGVTCTYFVEGWSADIYPDAVRLLHESGHEIGCHGWLHENWSEVASRDLEASVVAEALTMLRARGVDPRGFRPPGGALNDSTAAVLREQGLVYVSPAARRVASVDGLVVLPFRWKAIDAYYLFEAFAPLRTSFGDTENTMPPSRLIGGFEQVLEDVVATGGYVSLLFHPFLQDAPAHFAAMKQIIAKVADHADIWCATCAEHADWALRHPELLTSDPEFENASWQ